ncbi:MULTISPECIES: ImpA family metalloprotease [Vibrio]|uniref:ImpA family metalloprotease n=1 Tax=Vibrio TaxID=662 RepID=UPI000472822A|nr:MULTISPECIES: ImpA family metalloprotease [Vibrio]MBS9831693.1 ImpA family metalloprotease [Vibrio alginolyticus]MDA0096629.1 ImpA family metalloprotease [Vibrio sp. ART SEL2]ULF69788.1 ImpA family metalloprotease [Vibrio alginolyticus]
MKKTILSLGIAALATGCGGGEGESQPNAQVKPTQAPVQQALETGNALLVSDPSEFIRKSRQVVEAHKMQSNTIKSAIAKNLSGLYWDPTHDAAILAPQYGFNDTILMTNKAMASGYKDQALSIGVAGEKSNGQRYALLGSNPFRTAQRFPDSSNSAMTQWLSNLVTWLSGGVTSNVVIAQMDQSYYFPDEQATRNWLKDTVSQELAFNEANLCDGSKLLSCLQTNTPNLLILSQHLQSGDTNKPVLEALEYAEQAQIPVLYLHWDGGLTDLGQDILEKFHVDYVGDNYWRKLGLVDWEPSSLMNVVPDSVITQQALLSRFESQNFNVDLSLCDDKSCPDTANMDSQFYAGANSIRHWLQKLDEQKVDLFNQNGYQYEKLMVLLADHYRQTVVFPMDKQSTQMTEFLKSYFADYVQYNSRSVNPKQPNMGNFSRSEFSPDIKRISATINMESKRNFRSAGVYALPGETFTVKRNDSNDVATKIVINTLRSGATHEFSKDGYTRPKLLTSFGYEVKPGETITLTSPYGGPVQVHFDKNDVPVELKFNHVAQHPVWRSEKDNDAFIQQLEANLFDWAELITPGFEVHSKRDKMLESVNDEMWSTPSEMALATEEYVHNYPHVLAGFQGPGIDEVPEIIQYAQNQGWEIANIDIVKHMNADQATCGYGCSGNPYDAYWSFSPLGHGDLHELGHGLEKGRFRFSGWEGHSTTNYYSYYSKSRFFQNTGKVSTCQSLDFKGQFELLQASRTQADPNAYMAAQNQTSWSWGARVYIQIMMAAQHEGVLKSGWHLLARLHLIEREFNRLKSDDALWDERRLSIGFANYSREEANSISNSDWLLIALSYISQRDMTSYLDMWGFSFTEKAKQQVVELNLPPMPLTYFASSNTGYCLNEFAQTPITIDGQTVWPLNQ